MEFEEVTRGVLKDGGAEKYKRDEEVQQISTKVGITELISGYSVKNVENSEKDNSSKKKKGKKSSESEIRESNKQPLRLANLTRLKIQKAKEG